MNQIRHRVGIPAFSLFGNRLISTRSKHLEMLKRLRLPDGRPDQVAQRRYIEDHLLPTKLPKNKREQLQRIREFLNGQHIEC